MLEQIDPYLRTYKSKRARLILQDYLKLTPHNGKYTDRQRLARTHFENAVMAIKSG